MQKIAIERENLTADVSLSLIASLNAELDDIYPEPGANHFQLDPDEVSDGRGAFLVIYQDGTPIGCGALRLLDNETAELKRMYISPAERGKGLGRRLIAALESEGRTLGVRRLVLETGTRQIAALALYRAVGFKQIPLFGEYLRSPETSLCMAKDLSDVFLRPVIGTDLPIFFEHQRDPEANQMAAFPPRDLDAFMEKWNSILADDTLTKYAIIVGSDVAGHIVGWPQEGDMLIGYWVGKEFWGRGVATKALASLCELLDVRPLHAHVAKSNIGSIRVLEKCGFVAIDEHTGSDGVAELIMKLEPR